MKRVCLLSLVAELVLLFQFASADLAHAQFSGPSVPASTPVNRSVTLTTDPTVLYPASRELTLGAGDLISVHIYGTDYAPTQRISLDGSITLPLAGSISVANLSLHEAEKLIADRLVTSGMYRNPQVSIQLMESPNQIATVTGELHAVVPIIGQRRLFEVLAAAGGLPATASHTITIQRPGVSQAIVIDLGTDPSQSEKANVPIFAHDTILIARIGLVYVLGAFAHPGAIPLQQNSPLTLLQAASISGGPGFEGKMNDLRLIRTVGTERRIVHVDMKRVMNGQDPDPALQTDDIVFLPNNVMKAAIKSGGIGTLLGFASILVVSLNQ